MNQLQSDKFNIAWFKLAEFVARKEKERALAIYKLLVHALPEEALAAQLEGDLLLAFNDDKALQCYIRAADLYEADNNIIKAIAVCEHCLTLIPDAPEHVARLVKLYAHIDDTERMMRNFSLFIKLMVSKERTSEACDALNEAVLTDQQRAALSDVLVCETLSQHGFDEDLLKGPLCCVLDDYAIAHECKRLTAFLQRLSALNSQAYEYASRYLAEHAKNIC